MSRPGLKQITSDAAMARFEVSHQHSGKSWILLPLPCLESPILFHHISPSSAYLLPPDLPNVVNPGSPVINYPGYVATSPQRSGSRSHRCNRCHWNPPPRGSRDARGTCSSGCLAASVGRPGLPRQKSQCHPGPWLLVTLPNNCIVAGNFASLKNK